MIKPQQKAETPFFFKVFCWGLTGPFWFGLTAKGKMMPTTKSITSKQEVRIADLAAIAARNATAIALEQIMLDGDTAQVKIITEGGQFQELLKPEFEKAVIAALNKLSGRRHAAADEIERFYAEVLGMKIDLAGVAFPEKPGFPSYMVVMPGLNEDAVMQKITKRFGVKAYAWTSPIAENIDRKVEQSRSQGLYVFAHVGGDEPDAQHLGKSYDDAMEAEMIFANPIEYLLITGFHMWKHGKWMDSKGWTRTSSLWSVGHLVGGRWLPHSRGLYLDDGDRDLRNPDGGPRELFLG